MTHYDSFRAALTALAGHGHIKQRLTYAFDQHLADIDAASLPLTAREPFADLRLKMTQVAPLNGEGAICASVRKMSTDEASACSAILVNVFADVVRDGAGDVADAEPLTAENTVDVPAMLLKSV